ncbi:hypothetical protein KC19_11G017500 [Ceratodon purpureus]|uniref:Uncharacterized protein n=1 Tax=Ceratodon purpureus TaxID=3225 RepID=A0A8T0GFM1_CERPU|nr:hypothetical protein KC19_11G017500 [Ceratodon purpureus]
MYKRHTVALCADEGFHGSGGACSEDEKDSGLPPGFALTYQTFEASRYLSVGFTQCF